VSYNPLNLVKNNIIQGTNVSLGEVFDYEISFDNLNNTVAAVNVSVVDNLPAEVDFIAVTTNGAASAVFDPGTYTVVWDFGTLPPGAAGPTNYLTIRVRAYPPEGSNIVNTATIVCSNLPPSSQYDKNPRCPTCPPGVTPITNNPPIAVCQQLTVNNDAGVCWATVTPAQVDGGSSDPDGNPLTLTLTPPGPYPVGSATTVTLTVTDSSGLSDSCQTTVIVADAEAPQLLCPTNIVQGNDPGQCSAIVTYVAAATDNCTLATLICVPASGSTFPKGSTTVTCMATDGAGNPASCSFTVTVQDKEAPRVAVREAANPSGQKIPVAGKNPSSGQNPDGYYQLLAGDNCDAAPMLYVSDSASAFVAGPYKSGDLVKITQAPTATPEAKKMAGVVVAHITIKGDALVYAMDADGNKSAPVNAFVPPPPK
jgi:uncharacterized repeat protein (TIGR01451 family)